MPAALGNAQISSHPDLEEALAGIPGAAQIGLAFEHPPVPACYMLLLRELKRSGIEVGWSAGGSGAVRAAVLAAVDATAAAPQQIEPVLRCPSLPALVQAPADLGENVAILCAVDGTVKLGTSVRLGFSYHWLREVAAGSITGDLGVTIGGDSEASLDIALAGSFLTVATLDKQNWLRLRVFKRTEAALNAAWRLSVAARARTPLPEKPEELAAAMLGAHEGQWLDWLARLLKNAGGTESIAARLGVGTQALARWFELWNQLEARAAAAIWRAAGNPAELSAVRKWVHHFGADLRALGALKQALKEAIEADTPVARFIEGAARNLPAPLTGTEALGQLLHAAGIADKMLTEEGPAEVLGRLKQYAVRECGLARVERALESLDGFRTLDDWLQDRLRDVLGDIESDSDARRASRTLGAVAALARKIYEKALSAAEKKYSAEVSYQYERAAAETALLDCSFAFTAEGMAAYRRAVAGDFTQVLGDPSNAHLRLRHGTLSHGLRRQAAIELHLPFFDRREWWRRWEALTQAQIEAGDDGRVIVYNVDAQDRLFKKDAYQSALALSGLLAPASNPYEFTLSCTDKRSLVRLQARNALAPALLGYGFEDKVSAWLAAAPPSSRLEASLTLSVPGSLAACWLRAPGERHPEYFPVYAAVSVAVQQALRTWLPYAYFSELDRYGDLGAALPLVVYQSTRPFRGRPPGELTYDIMSPDSTDLMRRSTVRCVAQQLRRIQPLLIAAGRRSLAKSYSPEQARSIVDRVQRQPWQFNSLLVVDTFFVNSLVLLGTRGRDLGDTAVRDPRAAVRQLTRFIADFVTVFHRRLRRLYDGEGFVTLGALLLVEATRALGAALDRDSTIAAVLRLSTPAKEGLLEQTFVNAAFRP